MTDPKIDLKTPWVAGVLAYLIPGAGHLYQRRYFKAILFFVCVFGTFLYGMSLGNWKVVYWTENPGQDQFGKPWKRNYGYLAQLGIGCPSLFAYLQTSRYRAPGNRPTFINRPGIDERTPLLTPLDGQFTGEVVEYTNRHDPSTRKVSPITGTIHLEPHNLVFKGTFQGERTNQDGTTQPFECDLGATLFVDSKILGDQQRDIHAGVLDKNEQFQGDEIRGVVPRKFGDWFEAPLDNAALQRVNDRLTRRFEMALVYTWIAGLLNILVIWDAVQGPAYGYDDEFYRQARKSKDTPKPETKTKEASASIKVDAETAEAVASEEQQPAVDEPAPEAAGKTVES